MRNDLHSEMQRPHLEHNLSPLARIPEHLIGQLSHLLHRTNKETHLAEPHDHLGIEHHHTHHRGLIDHLAQQALSFRESRGEHQRVSEEENEDRTPEKNIVTIAQLTNALERADRERDIAPPDMEDARHEEPDDHDLKMADHLGQLQDLAHLHLHLLEPPQLAQHPAEETPNENSGTDSNTEAIMASLTKQQTDNAPDALDKALALPEKEVNDTKVHMGEDVDGPIAQIRRDPTRPLPIDHHLLHLPEARVNPHHENDNKALTARILQSLHQQLQLIKDLENAHELAQ